MEQLLDEFSKMHNEFKMQIESYTAFFHSGHDGSRIMETIHVAQEFMHEIDQIRQNAAYRMAMTAGAISTHFDSDAEEYSVLISEVAHPTFIDKIRRGEVALFAVQEKIILLMAKMDSLKASKEPIERGVFSYINDLFSPILATLSLDTVRLTARLNSFLSKPSLKRNEKLGIELQLLDDLHKIIEDNREVHRPDFLSMAQVSRQRIEEALMRIGQVLGGRNSHTEMTLQDILEHVRTLELRASDEVISTVNHSHAGWRQPG